MGEFMKNSLSPEELRKKRAINDAELLKDGAEYRADGSLEVTSSQRQKAGFEMQAFNESVEQKEFYQWGEDDLRMFDLQSRLLEAGRGTIDAIEKELKDVENKRFERLLGQLSLFISDLQKLRDNQVRRPYDRSGNPEEGKRILSEIKRNVQDFFKQQKKITKEPYLVPYKTVEE